jgi:hypothetical protein
MAISPVRASPPAPTEALGILHETGRITSTPGMATRDVHRCPRRQLPTLTSAAVSIAPRKVPSFEIVTLLPLLLVLVTVKVDADSNL